MDLYNKATTTPIFRDNIAQTSRVHSIVAKHQDFRNANKMLKMQGVPIKTLKMQGNANNTLKMSEHATKNSTLHEHAHRSEVMQHRFQIHDLLSFWRKLTSSRFQRHDVKRHHSEGR